MEMNSELWADSLREGELPSEPSVDRKTHKRRIPSIGKALPGMDQAGFLTPPAQKHGRSLSASNPSSFSPEFEMTPVSLLFSDLPSPETSPYLGVKNDLVGLDFNDSFDDLLTLPQKPRTVDPDLLVRRKSIHEKAHHSTSQLDQLLYTSALPPQGFLHKQASNEGFLNIVERFGSSFDKYRHTRHDSNCSSVHSSALTPPLPMREKSSQDLLGLLDNTIPDVGIQGFSGLFFTPGNAAEEEQNEHICLWDDCNRVFTEQNDLVNHILDDHVGSGQREYLCEWKDCPRKGMAFAKRHKIQNHLRIHTGERPFVCSFPGCDKKFSRQDGLSTHAKTHSSIKPFYCSFPGCSKAYYHSRSLKKHEKAHLSMNPNIDLGSQNSWNDQNMAMHCNQLGYYPNH